MNQPKSFQQFVQMKRWESPEGGAAPLANPGLLPQGTILFEDGSYVYPWQQREAEWSRTVGLPGLFGAGPQARFVPKEQ